MVLRSGLLICAETTAPRHAALGGGAVQLDALLHSCDAAMLAAKL